VPRCSVKAAHLLIVPNEKKPGAVNTGLGGVLSKRARLGWEDAGGFAARQFNGRTEESGPRSIAALNLFRLGLTPFI
jgi:hypothetical protein